MTIAEKYYEQLDDKDVVFDDMNFYCPSDFGYKDKFDNKCCDVTRCFECWMQEVEE